MAIQLGWYGTRGGGGTTEADMDSWKDTAINVYMSYGLWNQSWANWKTDAQDVVDLLKDSDAVDVDLIMEVSEEAIDDLRGTPTYTKIDYINTYFRENRKH